MDVTRLIATIKHKCGVELETEEVFMNTRYKDFIKLTISRRRGSDASSFQFSSVKLEVNGNPLNPHLHTSSPMFSHASSSSSSSSLFLYIGDQCAPHLHFAPR
jgi:hypothetical protein